MKASELIEQLQRAYKPDDQIIVDYWDKQIFENWTDKTIDDDYWEWFVDQVEADIWTHRGVFAEQAMDLWNNHFEEES